MLRLAVVTKGKYARKRERALQKRAATENGQAKDAHPMRRSALREDNPPSSNGTMGWLKVGSVIWGAIGFLAGVLLGPVIQQEVFGLLPASKTDAFLRAEIVTEPGKPNCHFYMFSLFNFGSVDYMQTKLQFPDPITSLRVGLTPETVLSDDQRDHNLQWSKGWDSQNRCVVSTDSLNASSDVQASINGHVIEVQTSNLPDPTHIIGLIATTSDLEPSRSKLWMEGVYEYSKFGQTIRKKLPIEKNIMPGAD